MNIFSNITNTTQLSNDAWLTFNAILVAILAFSYNIREARKDRILGFLWFLVMIAVLVSSACFFLNAVELGKIIIVTITGFALLLWILFFIFLYFIPQSWLEIGIKMKKHFKIGKEYFDTPASSK
jgi:glucose-6-phosphate-specific signal transduction histidine kinase